MCYVIITVRSAVWSVLTLCLFISLLTSGLSTEWLVTYPQLDASDNGTEITKTIGLFSVCIFRKTDQHTFKSCNIYATSISQIASPYWAACCFFIGLALLTSLIVTIFACGGFCFRSIGRKSIYSVSGLLQSISGLLLIFPPVLFPLGWNSELVNYDCAPSNMFSINNCRIGFPFFLILGCLVLTFLLSILSRDVDTSMRRRRIQHDIDHGKNPICGGF